LTLFLLRDDGAVVYLNGTEVWRSNMPSGTITYTTHASTTVSGAAEETFYQSPLLDSSLLNAGTNVLAVEIHQADAGSSDIGFDLELRGTTSVPPAPTNLTATAASASQIDLAWTDNSSNEDNFHTGSVTVTVGSATGSPASASAQPSGSAASLALPAAPSDLTAVAVSSTQIRLGWTDNTNSGPAFRIERSLDGTSWAEIGTVGANVTSFRDSGLRAGTRYYYRVRASSGVAASPYAAWVDVFTLL
jgi:hypothetical protein